MRRVDLPEPDGPTIAVEWPRSTPRLTPFKTCTEEAPSPSRRETFFISMTCEFNGRYSYMGEKRANRSIWGGLHAVQTFVGFLQQSLPPREDFIAVSGNARHVRHK